MYRAEVTVSGRIAATLPLPAAASGFSADIAEKFRFSEVSEIDTVAEELDPALAPVMGVPGDVVANITATTVTTAAARTPPVAHSQPFRPRRVPPSGDSPPAAHLPLAAWQSARWSRAEPQRD